MKMFALTIFLASLVLVRPALGDTLIEKKTVELNSSLLSEVLILDTAKFKRLRIGITKDRKSVSKFGRSFTVATNALDGENEIQMLYLNADVSISFLIDVPPTVMQIKLAGNGIFHLYVWGS